MNPEEIIHAFENGERELEPLLEKMGWKAGSVSPNLDLSEVKLSLFGGKIEPCRIKST